MGVKVSLMAVSLCATEDYACCPDCEKRTVFNDPSLAVAENLGVYKSSGVAWSVPEYVFQFAVFVVADVYYAMGCVNAWVVCFDRGVDFAAFHVAPDDIVAHLQGNHLLVVEYVFDDDYCPDIAVFEVLFDFFFFLQCTELRHTDTNCELLPALRTFENERLAVFIISLIESYVVVALRASDSFHRFL